MTSFEELPLLYKNRNQEGTLFLSYNVNVQNRVIQGQFLWAIQKDNKEVVASGIVKGLKKLDKSRDGFIAQGWERYSMPKIQIKKEKKEEPIKFTEEEIIKIEAELQDNLNPADKEARAKAIQDISNHNTSFTKWLME